MTGSSLLHGLVGKTEMAIRDMFEPTEEEGVIVFLDEGENLLQRRDRAVFGWERQQTNEFLAQMEWHNTVFICATNEQSIIDRSVMRRFSLRVAAVGKERLGSSGSVISTQSTTHRRTQCSVIS